MPIILVTGAAGRIGTMLRPRLARPGRTLRLLDTAGLEAGPGAGGRGAGRSLVKIRYFPSGEKAGSRSILS